MSKAWLARVRDERGYTLVEVVIACALGAVLMSALTSVILTSVRATTTASSRIEASSQIRAFEFYAFDDFARSHVPSACPGQPATSCLVLSGQKASGTGVPVVQPYQVTYAWDGTSFLDRQVGTGAPIHVATDVTAFSWYVDTSSSKVTCVVTLTITVDSYSETQTHRFYPQLQ